jgi:hypothetical protein
MKTLLTLIALVTMLGVSNAQIATFTTSARSDSLKSTAQQTYVITFRTDTAVVGLDTLDFYTRNYPFFSDTTRRMNYDSSRFKCPIYVEHRDSVYTDGRYIHRATEEGPMQVRITPLVTGQWRWFEKPVLTTQFYYYKVVKQNTEVRPLRAR